MQGKQCGLVVAVAAVVMLVDLGGTRLWDRDEPRNAGCAREMWLRGDWIVPTFNGELRTHKPVLLYWCIMVSYAALGVNEFAARLPSALCAIGTTVCVYLMGRRLFGARAGCWAGIALATSLMFVLAGRAATPDSVLIFCSTLAMTIFVLGTFEEGSRLTPRDERISRSEMPTMLTTVAMYAAMGLAVLAKGPVGFVLPTAVIGMFLLIVRLPCRNATEGVPYRWLSVLAPFAPRHFLATCWSMRPVTAVLTITAVALPWYWAVGAATDGEFLRGFLFEHNLGRATAAMEGHHGSIFYYPVAILIGFFPWSVFAVPLAIDTVRQMTGRDGEPQGPRLRVGLVFAVCWIGVYVVLFSLARTKLPSYVTPCYPALALLAGSYVDRWSRQAERGPVVAGRWLTAAFTCLGLVGVAIAIGIWMAARQYLPGDEWLGLIGLAPLVGGVVCIGLSAVQNYRAAAGTFAATAMTFVVLLFAVGAGRADRHQMNHVLLDAMRARSPEPQITSYKVLEPSWVFYAGRTIRETNSGDGKGGGARVAEFLRCSSDAYVITTQSRLGELLPRIGAEFEVLASAPYFLRDERLVVLGRNRQPAKLAREQAEAAEMR